MVAVLQSIEIDAETCTGTSSKGLVKGLNKHQVFPRKKGLKRAKLMRKHEFGAFRSQLYFTSSQGFADVVYPIKRSQFVGPSF